MATGRPLIFESVTIKDFGSTDNVVVTLTDDENITIGNEPIEVLVEGGQTIQNGFNQELTIIAYDLNSIDGTGTNTGNYIQSNATLTANTANITLDGVAGSVDVAINNVRVTAMRPFNDGLTRDHVMIKATLTATTGISVTNV